MVDFQSRDTKRGFGSLTEDDEDDDKEDDEQTAEDESTDEPEAATEDESTAESDGASEVAATSSVTETETATGATDSDEDSEFGGESPLAEDVAASDVDRTGGEPASDGKQDQQRQSRTVTEEYAQDALPYAVVTVAADRSIEEDRTGDAVIDAVTHADDAVVTRELLAPAYDGVQSAVDALVDRDDVEAIVTVGGTGVEPTDVTVDAVSDLFDKHLPGFGELFRVLSHDQEGTAIVRTRATAGLIDDVPVFCLPGETDAARRGVEQIVLDEAPELATQASAAETHES